MKTFFSVVLPHLIMLAAGLSGLLYFILKTN